MAKRYNPFAPLTAKQQRRQARNLVNSQIMPLIQQINAEANRRNTAGQAAISSGSNALAASLAPLAAQTHQNYAEAQNVERGDVTALADRLKGLGASEAAKISGMPGISPSSGGTDLGAIGTGASNAGFAYGSSGLAQLIAQGASAENYNAGLPGIARMGGQYAGNNFRQQIESERARGVGDIRSKIPGLVSQTSEDIRNTELQKAVAL